MNAPNDLRWIMFANVPVHGYANINVVTPVARGIVRLVRRLARSAHTSPGHLVDRRPRAASS